MNCRTRQLVLAVSIALGTAGAGLQADITIDPGAGNGVVIPNINTQPGFATPMCYDATGQTGELGNCLTPPAGPTGPAGATGPKGDMGDVGPAGLQGVAGPKGDTGDVGPTGPQGASGAQGTPGVSGATGPTGPAGVAGNCAFADFYALMPPDNAATVAVDMGVDFPQNGASSGQISRMNSNDFSLPAIGTYQVMFQVSVTEAGQLGLRLNGAELPFTVVGRATGTSQIVGISLIETTVPFSVLSVVNPSGNSTALTITPLAGGTAPVSAHLVITQLPGAQGCASGATGATGPTGATG